jgi:hypothetical protein
MSGARAPITDIKMIQVTRQATEPKAVHIEATPHPLRLQRSLAIPCLLGENRKRKMDTQSLELLKKTLQNSFSIVSPTSG